MPFWMLAMMDRATSPCHLFLRVHRATIHRHRHVFLSHSSQIGPGSLHFALEIASRLLPGPPPELSSATYTATAVFNEVKSL
jgi:hypothetical protein